ncbi:MAG: phosphate propanoyltransferase [Peptococcaceae bacterium]
MSEASMVDQVVNAVVDAIGKEYVQVEVSARHVHLSQADLETLFGPGAALTPKRELSQPGQFLSEQRVNLIGPKGRKDNVSVLGPVRKATQVELSKSDARGLGVKAPLRESGDVAGSGSITLEGPKGSVTIPEGVIVAHCHIHMTNADARRMGLADNQHVSVEIGGERPIVFKDVIVRVSDKFRCRMHIDTDEGNATSLGKLTLGRIIK